MMLMMVRTAGKAQSHMVTCQELQNQARHMKPQDHISPAEVT